MQAEDHQRKNTQRKQLTDSAPPLLRVEGENHCMEECRIILFGTRYAMRLWVPSPLAGEGQEEGDHGHWPEWSRLTLTLSLALSHQGRGEDKEAPDSASKFVPNTIGCCMKRDQACIDTSGNHFPPLRFFTPPSVTRR